MSLIRVLITNPPAYLYDDSKHYIQAGSRWSHTLPIPKGDKRRHYLPYPFYIGYASTLLQRDTEALVYAFDACAHDFDEQQFIEYIIHLEPDVLVVEVPTLSFPYVMRTLKEITDNIDCFLVLTGFHVSALWQSVLKQYPFVNCCLIGEYEFSLRNLVLTLQEGKPTQQSYNPAYASTQDLDQLPYPDRFNLDIHHYRNKIVVGEPSIVLWSSRGCPFRCSFCVEQQVFYKPPIYRRRDPVKVVNEMEFCMKQFKPKQLDFDDQTLTGNTHHITQICNEIISRKLDIPWVCMGDMNLDYNTLLLMKNAGCQFICFGVETMNAPVLKNIGKQFVQKSKALQFREWCRELDIRTHATYMIGLPGDTTQGLNKTVEFAKQLDTDSAQFSIATPYPGTQFYEQAVSEGWLTTQDWTQYDGRGNSVVSYPHLNKEEIEFLYQITRSSWKNHLRKRDLKNPKKLWPNIKKGVIKCVGFLQR